MSSSVIKTKIISASVTEDVSKKAAANLKKQGLTVPEYIRLALIKAANNEVRLVSFLDTPEALAAKNEAVHSKSKRIGSPEDFDKWLDNL
ncbi:MAG: RelB [Lactobacillus sp.]|jgi:DNA-damage-inducible protein J|nr:RelB [Lactobacillus sp.]